MNRPALWQDTTTGQHVRIIKDGGQDGCVVFRHQDTGEDEILLWRDFYGSDRFMLIAESAWGDL